MAAPTRIQSATQHGESRSLAVAQLSKREWQILARLVEGDSYKEIAGRLGISVQTVNDHIKSLYRKLDVHSRAHAVIRFQKWIANGGVAKRVFNGAIAKRTE